MGARSFFDPDLAEPLALQRLGCLRAGAGELRRLSLEYTSRGDRVVARVRLPAGGDGPHPLLLVSQDTGRQQDPGPNRARGDRARGDRARGDRARTDWAGADWARRGVAVAEIDLPLHGARYNAKLSAWLHSVCEAQRCQSPLDAELWVSFVRQCVVDLRRALTALGQLDEIDADRSAFAGFGLGAVVGALFCAEEPRVRAVALAGAGGGIGPVAADPLGHVGRLAPRPVLFVNATQDPRVPSARAELLHEAARQPKQVLWIEGSGESLPAESREAIASFLLGNLTPERG